MTAATMDKVNKQLTREGMTRLSAGMQEIHRVLGRPADASIEDIAGGRPAYRAMILRDKLLAGVILDKGELFDTMAGFRDEELGLGASHEPSTSLSAAGQSKSQTNTRTRVRATCKDCAGDIKDPTKRLKSDLARCIDCARKKKAQYNASYRAKAAD